MSDGMGGVTREIQALFDRGVYGPQTDGQLLARFVDDGDDEALGALIHRHGAMVWGVCRRILRDDHDAEDACQATFLVLVRRAAEGVPREKVGVWLHGVARQTALKARSVKARRRGRERPMPAVPAAGGMREEPADDRLVDFDRELSRLPEKYRAPIVLCELEGRSYQEAADQLRWPIRTLSGRLSRGRALLARRLSRRGQEPSIGPIGALFAGEAAPARVPSSVLSSTIQAVTSSAPSPAASPISPGVAALAEGVIKTMMLTRLRSIAIPAALALGLCGVAGAVVGVGHYGEDKGADRAAATTAIAQAKEQGAAGQSRGSPTADPKAALLRARETLARKGYDAAFEALQQTQRQGDVLVVLGRPEEVYRWSIRRLQAERERHPQGWTHLAALEAHLNRMIELDKRVERLNKELLPDTAKFDAEWYVLEARLWLEQEKE